MQTILKTGVIASVVVAATSARADDSRDLAVGAAAIVGRTDVAYDLGGAAEATVRVIGPVHARARMATGAAHAVGGDEQGVFLQGLAGFEARSCIVRGRGCVLAGLATGWESQTIHHAFIGSAGPLVGGNLGFDVGSDALRVRLTADMLRRRVSFMDSGESTQRWGGDYALMLGAALRFD